MYNDQLIERLQALTCFRDFPRDMLACLIRGARVRLYEPGERIFEVGAPLQYGHVLLYGLAVLQLPSLATGPGLPVGIVRQGELFDTAGLLPGDQHPVAALALLTSEVLEAPRETIEECLQQHPLLLQRATEYLSRHYYRLIANVQTSLQQPVNYRVALALLQAREAVASDIVPITQALLAQMVGATRESTANVLGVFRREGWIETHRGGVRIRDAAALQNYLTGT